MVEPTHLKKYQSNFIPFPQVWLKIKIFGNHHLVYKCKFCHLPQTSGRVPGGEKSHHPIPPVAAPSGLGLIHPILLGHTHDRRIETKHGTKVPGNGLCPGVKPTPPVPNEQRGFPGGGFTWTLKHINSEWVVCPWKIGHLGLKKEMKSSSNHKLLGDVCC